MRKIFTFKTLAASLAAAALTACGGGSSNSGTPSTTTFAVGGSVSGLTGTLSVQNNGADTQQRSSSGAFTFAKRLDNGAAYAVSVSGTPLRQECTVGNGAGTVAGADVTNVAVSCRDRGWEVGQALETDDNPVVLVRAGMADDASIVAVFVKSNGLRNVLYATRGKPNTNGTTPTWSVAVAIDGAGSEFYLPPSFASNHLAVSVAANGNANVAWVHSKGCSATSYRPFTAQLCSVVFSSSYDAATASWSTPVLIGETPASSGLPGFGAQFGLQTKVDTNGNVAVLYADWLRSGTTSWTYHPAVAWKTKSQTAFTSRRFDDLTPYLTSLWPFALTMDASGNMTVAGNQTQPTSANRDVIAYRGTLSGGFPSATATVIDQLGADADFVGVTAADSGEAIVAWSQNNGSAIRYLSARSAGATAAWGAPLDVGPAVPNDFATLVSAGADALLYVNCGAFRWSSSNASWGAVSSFPTNCGRNSKAAFAGYSSEGSYLSVDWSKGLWRTYDSVDNTMGHAAPTGTPAAGDYVLGVVANAATANTLFDVNTSDGVALISPNGIGAYLGLAAFDQLPTASSPNGNGRANIINLWGVYLK